jgi:hypothetical protein
MEVLYNERYNGYDNEEIEFEGEEEGYEISIINKATRKKDL